MIPLLRLISRFALMPNGEHQHGISLFLVAVQRDITSPATRNDQFPHVVLGGATEQGVIPENLHSFRDQFNRLHGRGRGRLGFEEKIRQPSEIGESAPRINQPRQALAFGLETVFPRARALI